jgi:short-subunit dehydrogenase
VTEVVKVIMPHTLFDGRKDNYKLFWISMKYKGFVHNTVCKSAFKRLSLNMQKTAVITGGSKGIGLALVERFLHQGFKVLSISRSTGQLSPLQDQYGQNLTVLMADLSQKQVVLDTAQIILQQIESIDVLINNAGVFLPGAIAQESDEDFELQMALNLNASYYLTKRLIPNLAKGGYVFNICSTASEKAYANGSSYCISKHALLGFTRVLRAELMSQGIAVSAVLPGPTLTDSWQGTELPVSRFIKTEAISSAIFMAWENRSSMVMEQITLRPMLGDI